MPRVPVIIAAGFLAAAALWHPLPVEGAASPGIPALGAIDAGWRAVGNDFLPPVGGTGPVTADPAHPYIANGRGAQPTYRVADLSHPMLKPWAVESMRKANEAVLRGAIPFVPRDRCWPAGVPAFALFSQVELVFFIQTPRQVLILHQGDQQVRRISMNEPHSANPKPSWYGESVGHYENGDTLVVDTIGLNERTFVDNYRTPHTGQLHVVERYKLLSGGRGLELTVSVEDPGAFNMPWSARQTYNRVEQGLFSEAICAENNDAYFGYNVFPIPQADQPDF